MAPAARSALSGKRKPSEKQRVESRCGRAWYCGSTAGVDRTVGNRNCKFNVLMHDNNSYRASIGAVRVLPQRPENWYNPVFPRAFSGPVWPPPPRRPTHGVLVVSETPLRSESAPPRPPFRPAGRSACAGAGRLLPRDRQHSDRTGRTAGAERGRPAALLYADDASGVTGCGVPCGRRERGALLRRWAAVSVVLCPFWPLGRETVRLGALRRPERFSAGR